MKIFMLFLLLFLPILSYCQPLTYDDAYDCLGTAVDGKITVGGYKILDGERVLNGPFSFYGTKYDRGASSTLNITCALKDGQWDGPYSFLTKVSYLTTLGDFTVKGNYKAGKLDGKWIFVIKYSDTKTGSSSTVNHTLTFKENLLKEGSFKNYGVNVLDGFPFSKEVKTDDNGYLHGRLPYKHFEDKFEVEEFFTYCHGVLVAWEKKDVKTNTIMKKETYNEDSIFIDKNYVASSNSFITSAGKEYKITPGDEECKSHFLDERQLKFWINISPLKKSVQKFGFPIIYPRVAKIIDVAAEKAEAERAEKERILNEKKLKAEQKHLEVNNLFNQLSLTDLLQRGKKTLHNSYMEIYNGYIEKIKNEKEHDSLVKYYDNLTLLSERLIVLKTSESKEIEKALKKAVNIEEKESILMK